MAWNLPDGCTDADIERAYGYEEPEEPEVDSDWESILEHEEAA